MYYASRLEGPAPSEGASEAALLIDSSTERTSLSSHAKRERADRAHLECAVEKRSQRALLEVLRGEYTTGSRWSGDHRRQLLIDITLEYQALEIERHRMTSNARED